MLCTVLTIVYAEYGSSMNLTNIVFILGANDLAVCIILFRCVQIQSLDTPVSSRRVTLP